MPGKGVIMDSKLSDQDFQKIRLQLIDETDINNVLNIITEWHTNKDINYLHQWAGVKYEFPITVDMFKMEGAYLYKIIVNETNEMIGIIQLTQRRIISKFLIKEEFTGKGYGKVALDKIIRIAFTEFRATKLLLGVSVTNARAINLYHGFGFRKIAEYANIDMPTYEMSLDIKDFISLS